MPANLPSLLRPVKGNVCFSVDLFVSLGNVRLHYPRILDSQFDFQGANLNWEKRIRRMVTKGLAPVLNQG